MLQSLQFVLCIMYCRPGKLYYYNICMYYYSISVYKFRVYRLKACHFINLQEPWLVNNSTIEMAISPDDQSIHLNCLDTIMTIAVKYGKIPGAVDQRSGNPLLGGSGQSIYTLLEGYPYEASQFLSQMPLFFFIIYELHKFADDDGISISSTETLLAPVVLKNGYYYLCTGEGKGSIYRIHDPAHIFFSPNGHQTLLHCIRDSFPEKSYEVSFQTDLQHKPKERLCIPKTFHEHEPTKWDVMR